MNTYLPNRKRNLMLLFALLMGFAGLTKGYAYSFSAICPSGQTLYYNITDETNHYVEVTYPYTFSNPWGNYSTPEGDLVLPTTILYNGNIYYTVTSISDGAFYDCDNITSITISNSVTSIGSSAFRYCNQLTSVIIGSSVTSIGYYAFEDCYSLASINIPNSVISIGNGAFDDCFSLTSITIPNSVTMLGAGAFSNCSRLTGNLIIPNSITSIYMNTFDNCYRLTSLTIPNSVTSIADDAFNSCYGLEQIIVESGNVVYDSRNNCNAIIKTSNNELVLGCKNTVILNTVTSIGNKAFKYCRSLTSIEIPNSVTSIGDEAFYDCDGLTSIVIPNSVVSIGHSAFCWDNGLTSLLISSSVASIGNGAFYYCSSLTSMTILPETPVSIDSSVFNGVPKSIPIHVPCGSMALYQTTSGWSEFTNYQELACSYTIEAISSPVEGGIVTGAGNYEEGATCTLTATPNNGFIFASWTKNGAVVSTNATYSFTVTEAESYVANFVAIPPYFTIESIVNNNTITFNIPSGITSEQLTSVSYSTDGTNWTTLNVNHTDQSIGVTLNVGEKVYFKGIGIQYGYEDEDEDEIYNCHISATGDFNAFGNTMSLLYGDNFASMTEFNYDSDATFYGLFKGNTHLVSAENLQLPANDLPYKCYEGMFEGCSSLTTAPELPATSLGPHSYGNMFKGCSSLITPPELPATNVYQWAYYYMFSGCTSLTVAPELPATTIRNYDYYCYTGMFSGCTSLTTAPSLPATTLAWSCYSSMFSGCTSLTSAPELPASTLASSCYSSMFSGCTSLTSAPELPASTLASSCYSSMFSGCTSLTEAPELPATTLADWCYNQMFKNCSLINEITCLATDISATNCTKDWLSGVASTGTFHKSPEMQDWPINSPSGIPEGWTVLGNRFEITAAANPSEGGTITGSGMYDEGSAATLSATPNEGYFFVNWTENGEEVSTEATYSFTVTGDRTLVANFSQNNCHWTPVTGMSGSMTMLAILKIDGVQSYANNMEIGAFSGQECRGTALPQYYQEYCFYSLNIVGNTDGDPITFRLYDHHLNQELDLYCSNELNFVDGEAYGFDNFYEINFFNLVQITAMADPAEGGSTNGTGSYYNLSPCTLGAVANEGYSFQYWTLNDEVVSSDATYSFEVNGAADYVAHFSLNSYEISVTVQPTEGGSVSGNGTYNHFAICTLTAEANTGYSFESWTLNGEVVSNEPIYNFEVSSAANYVANFSPNNYEIIAIANPSNGGTIEGTGTYSHFQTCTLTATANEGYQFNSWIMDGVIVSTETTYSFVVSGPVTITAMFDVMQTVVLSQGWTWWGSSVELSSLGQDGGLSMLEESMNPNGRVIKTIDKFVHYQVTLGQWIGGLNRLTNEESYRIQTITPCTVSFTGPAAHPENHPINIQQYWNWIGYPVSQPQTVATALGNYQPSFNDVIKGQGGYATYLPDVGWMPQYFTLNPGQSYMYYSVNSENQTLVYANGRGDVPVAEPDHRHWRNDIHAFADNLCLMAVVTVDGVEQRSEELELGAFVNGECRGSARLLYIEPLDRYYAMMTVTGQDNEVVEFAMIDMSHHQISTSSTTRLTFSNDAICGTYDNPYTVAFGTMTSIEEHTSSMCLYPNPINRNETFNLVIPEDEEIVELTVVNTSGAVVRRETGAIKRHAVPGLSVTGLYMVHVVCKSGNVYHGRLMVD